MQAYQREFINLAIHQGVLRFGQFSLKSGRISPYFFNAGLFNSGSALARLASCYAQTIVENQLAYDMLFGPAYKGIPLVSATSMALFNDFGRDVPYAYNRKEKKDHGEGGMLVGAPLEGKALIIDDVMTAGTAVREVIELVSSQSNAEIAGVVVAIDRQEKGKGDLSAIQEIEKEFNIPVASIVSLDHVLSYIKETPELAQHLEAVTDYRNQYGIQ